MSMSAHLQCLAHHVSVTFAHARACPYETGAHSRDASIPAKYGDLLRPRAVVSNGHVCHIGRDARAHRFARIYHVTHDGRYNHDDHDYPGKIFLGYNGYNQA
jgi:hypothetical protein